MCFVTEFFKMKLNKLIKKILVLFLMGLTEKLDLYHCNYCIQEYTFHTTRMSSHLLKCSRTPEVVKNQIIQKGSKASKTTTDEKNCTKRKRINSSDEKSDTRDTENLVPQERTNAKQAVNINMNCFLDRTTPQNQLHYQKLLAKAIYTSGIEFYLL